MNATDPLATGATTPSSQYQKIDAIFQASHRLRASSPNTPADHRRIEADAIQQVVDVLAETLKQDDVDLLPSLAHQAANTIENSGIYASMLDEIGLHRQAEDELRQAKVELEILIDKHTTELAHTSAALETEQLKFLHVTESIPGALCIFKLKTDGALCIPYASKAFEELYGLTLADVSENIDMLTARVPPEEVVALIAAVEISVRTMQVWRHEYRYNHPSKGEIWIEGHSTPVAEPDGALLWYGIATDVTNRKRVEQALRDSNTSFAQMANNIQEVFWMFDNGRQQLVYLSPAYETIWGRTAEETYQNNNLYIEGIHPEDRAIMLAALQQQAKGERTEMEYRVVRPNGEVRWIHDRSFPILDEAGVVLRTTGIAADVTGRKHAEIALRLSEEKYRGLVESLDSVIATVDADGRFHYMNDIAAAQLGDAASALVGKTMYDLFPAAIASRQLEHIRWALCNDASASYEAQSRVQGNLRWYRTTIQPIHDEFGNPVFALVSSTDIHELKQAQQDLLDLNRTLEERVLERTAQVRDLYENAPTGYHSLDAHANIIQINQTELTWLDYTINEVVGRSFSSFITPLCQMEFQNQFLLLKERGWLRDLESEMVRRDGSSFPVLISAKVTYNSADHAFETARFTVFDNTDRKQAEVALRESEEQTRLLFEESPDAMALFDATGACVRANRACAQLTRYPITDIIGCTADELGLVPTELASNLDVHLQHQLSRHETYATSEHSLRRADGVVVTVESRIFLLRIRSTDHVLITSRDITVHKEAENALRIANAEIERALRLKDEFLANMSHELRTPLSGILALSETLQEQIYGPLNERQQRSLHNIEVSGRHLLSLINDLLDLSKIEAGKLELTLETARIDDISHASLLFIKEIAAKKRILVSYRNEEPRAMVHVDVRRLKQMLVNLLSNAVKFTPEGGNVALNVLIPPSADVVEFAVVDNGIGITPENLQQLFQPFTQLDSALARQYEGTGLGLALVKRLAVQHGGTVRVESSGIPGQGSSFTISLPYVQLPVSDLASTTMAPPSAPNQEVASSQSGASLLLAEDNEVTIEALGAYLEHLGYKLLVARTGRQALEFALTHLPDLILMDVQLPLLDGLEVTRRLRRDHRLANTPIIAITALAMLDDRDRCLRAGATSYMSKPVQMTELAALIQHLLA